MPALGEVAATNWYPPSYSPKTGLLYVSSLEYGSSPRYGAMRALDPQTGEKKWEFRKDSAIFKAGALSTASDLLFTGVLGQGATGGAVDGEFYVLEARTGQLLWQRTLPASVQSGR
jgi:alcohol dehydrogenase (cytochrome c)